MKKHLTLQQKLMLGCSALLVGVLLLLGVTIIPQRLRSFNTELDDRIALTARIVAESSDAENALTAGKAPAEWMARLDALSAETVGLDYVVVADRTGKRIYHSRHELIGQQFVGGDEAAAEQGSAPYTTTGIGTAELQRRAFQTVYNKEGSPIGFVMVSASVATIQRKKLELLRSFLLVFAPALAAGLGSSWLLARSVRDALLGHGLGTFVQMYLQREEVLDHLSECLLAVTPCSDQLIEWAEYIFLAKTVPLDKAGVLVILRDHTEYTRIDQQLTGTNHVLEALRANTHEFLNKLHVISGLLQIGETQKAIAFINGVSEDVENNYQSIIRQLHNRTVAALVLGKASHARELYIQFSLRRDSTLPAHSAYLSSRELVTIVGNLVENAFEAVKAAPLKQVGLFIGEDANGHDRYTTKGDGHGFGLRLIQQIVAGRRGYLEIESEPGEGSSFTVNFTQKREVIEEC